MSTVQDLYNTLAYRRDIQVQADALIPIVNQAIRTIAKRLYFLESDLITAQMSVPIYSEQVYTAATIGFTASTSTVAGTITDSAAQFVAEGFAVGMPITTNSTLNPGPFRIAAVTTTVITLVLTDTVVVEAEGSSKTITSDDAYGFLPSDFWGMRDKPYLDTKTWALVPLPSQDVDLQYSGPGEPLYYKIRGMKVYMTPHAGGNYTLKGDYFSRPSTVTLTTSTVPFNELFDDLIAEYIAMYFRNDATAVERQILDKELKEGVDLAASKYDRQGPVVAPGIYWGSDSQDRRWQ